MIQLNMLKVFLNSVYFWFNTTGISHLGLCSW